MTKIYQTIARYMPRKLLYFAVIQAWAIATTGKHSNRTPDSLKWNEVLNSL